MLLIQGPHLRTTSSKSLRWGRGVGFVVCGLGYSQWCVLRTLSQMRLNIPEAQDSPAEVSKTNASTSTTQRTLGELV